MPGQKNAKYAYACNQTQQFVEKMNSEAKKLPPKAILKTSTRIDGTVNLEEDAERDFSVMLDVLKNVGTGKLSMDRELVRHLTGEAAFSVEASLELDNSKATPK